MKTDTQILRFFISNTDKFRHAPFYETIVYAAKRYGLNGATVFRGTMGFGSSSVIHSVKFWEIAEKVPVVIEIIDEKEKIDCFIEKILPWSDKLKFGCLITVEDVRVVLHIKGSKKK